MQNENITKSVSDNIYWEEQGKILIGRKVLAFYKNLSNFRPSMESNRYGQSYKSSGKCTHRGETSLFTIVINHGVSQVIKVNIIPNYANKSEFQIEFHD